MRHTCLPLFKQHLPAQACYDVVAVRHLACFRLAAEVCSLPAQVIFTSNLVIRYIWMPPAAGPELLLCFMFCLLPLQDNSVSGVDYVQVMLHVVMPVAYEFQPDVIIISAGFDGAGACAICGVLRVACLCGSSA